MLAVEQRQNVTANNIANAATPGFKRQQPVDKGFNQIIYEKFRNPFWPNRATAPGGSLELNETFTDYAAGPLNHTGNDLDVAIQGPGFISVQTPSGERYTRDGAFSMGADGLLVTVDGYPILDEGGQTINVDGAAVHIGSDGLVAVDGQQAGRIRLTEFEDPHMLKREGSNLWSASDQALQRSAPAENTELASGTLEMSNVQLPREMVSMILAARSYEANQRVVNAIDETASRLIDHVASAG